LLFLGHPDRAMERSDAAIATARQLAHPYSLALSLAFGTMLRWLSNDDAEFEQLADQLLAIATEQRFTQWESAGSIFCGWIKVKNGNVAEGLSQLASGSAAYRNAGSAALMPLINLLHARALEIAGRVDEATSLLDETLLLVAQTGECWFDAELHRQKGDLLLRQSNTGTADDLYRKALSVAVGQGAKLWELRAATSLARLLGSRGRRAEARDLLAPVYGWFTEGFDTPDLKEAAALLAELT
jgi:predicted ATPase